MSLEQYQDFSPSSVMDSPIAMTTAPSSLGALGGEAMERIIDHYHDL